MKLILKYESFTNMNNVCHKQDLNSIEKVILFMTYIFSYYSIHNLIKSRKISFAKNKPCFVYGCHNIAHCVNCQKSTGFSIKEMYRANSLQGHFRRINMNDTLLKSEINYNTSYETAPWGNQKDFDLPKASNNIIDAEYTVTVPSIEIIATNDNNPDNQPTPPATSTALIPYGNATQLVSIPQSPENLMACIELNQGIAKTAMNLAQKHSLTKTDMAQLYQKAWKHAAIVFEAQSRLGSIFKDIQPLQGRRTDLLKNSDTNTSQQLPGKTEKKLTKEEFIKQNWGYDSKKAWELELLTDEKLKRKTYETARKNEEYPSLKLALKIRKEEREKLSVSSAVAAKNQAKHNANQKKIREKAIKDAIKFSKLTRKTSNVLQNQLYDVIYADFIDSGISFDNLKNLQLPANENAVLLLWTNCKNLPLSLELAQTWGFKYQESAIWNYMAPTAGKYVKIQHRQLLICTKGEEIQPEYQESSVLNLHKDEAIDAKNHYYAMVEQMFPDGAYLDLSNDTAYNSKWTLLKQLNASEKGE